MASPSIKAVQLILLKLLEGLSAVNQDLYYVLDKVYLKNVYVYTNHVHSCLILNIFDHSYTLPFTSHMKLNSEL